MRRRHGNSWPASPPDILLPATSIGRRLVLASQDNNRQQTMLHSRRVAGLTPGGRSLYFSRQLYQSDVIDMQQLSSMSSSAGRPSIAIVGTAGSLLAAERTDEESGVVLQPVPYICRPLRVRHNTATSGQAFSAWRNKLVPFQTRSGGRVCWIAKILQHIEENSLLTRLTKKFPKILDFPTSGRKYSSNSTSTRSSASSTSSRLPDSTNTPAASSVVRNSDDGDDPDELNAERVLAIVQEHLQTGNGQGNGGPSSPLAHSPTTASATLLVESDSVSVPDRVPAIERDKERLKFWPPSTRSVESNTGASLAETPLEIVAGNGFNSLSKVPRQHHQHRRTLSELTVKFQTRNGLLTDEGPIGVRAGRPTSEVAGQNLDDYAVLEVTTSRVSRRPRQQPPLSGLSRSMDGITSTSLASAGPELRNSADFSIINRHTDPSRLRGVNRRYQSIATRNLDVDAARNGGEVGNGNFASHLTIPNKINLMITSSSMLTPLRTTPPVAPLCSVSVGSSTGSSSIKHHANHVGAGKQQYQLQQLRQQQQQSQQKQSPSEDATSRHHVSVGRPSAKDAIVLGGTSSAAAFCRVPTQFWNVEFYGNDNNTSQKQLSAVDNEEDSATEDASAANNPKKITVIFPPAVK